MAHRLEPGESRHDAPRWDTGQDVFEAFYREQVDAVERSWLAGRRPRPGG